MNTMVDSGLCITKIRKVCMSCLLTSDTHNTDSCKRCGYSVFGNIDDFVEQDCLNNNNLLVARELRDQARKIEQECKQFTKTWDKLWGSGKDMDFNLVSELEQEDYSYLAPKD